MARTRSTFTPEEGLSLLSLHFASSTFFPHPFDKALIDLECFADIESYLENPCNFLIRKCRANSILLDGQKIRFGKQVNRIHNQDY